MATSNNTIKTRLQLKSDTEAKWKEARSPDGRTRFIPLAGEVIIFSPDLTHSYSRVKIGDGSTDVIALPFIDAGTFHGDDEIVAKYSDFTSFPSPGSPSQLYVDLSTGRIYHYAIGSGYSELCNFVVDRITIGSVTSWTPGITTDIALSGNVLKITQGALPELLWEKRLVVSDVYKEENNNE